jgi:gluconolactonase
MTDEVTVGPWRAEAVPRRTLEDVTVLAEGLAFPEGPIAMADGSVLVTEIERGTLTRVAPDGEVSVVATPGGGPNGAAIGPDGAVYLCNNGGRFASGNWNGGWIERVDLATGAVDVLYSHYEGRRLSGPNDIVFDDAGNFWVTDTGKFRGRERDVGSLYWGRPDGSELREVAHPAETPNGVGLSPDQQVLYYAETVTARLRRRTITGLGQLAPVEGLAPETLVCGLPGHQGFDSLAVDAEGNVCIATLVTGGITVVSPDGERVVQHLLPPGLEDHMTTNICFGGPDRRTAFITLGSTGRLIACPWEAPGLALAFDG